MGLFDGIQLAGRTSLSTDHDDQSGVSEEGYIMDMSLVSKLINNFDAPARKMKKDLYAGVKELGDFYASIRLDHMSMETFRKLPTFLDLRNLGMYFLLCSVSELSLIS